MAFNGVGISPMQILRVFILSHIFALSIQLPRLNKTHLKPTGFPELNSAAKKQRYFSPCARLLLRETEMCFGLAVSAQLAMLPSSSSPRLTSHIELAARRCWNSTSDEQRGRSVPARRTLLVSPQYSQRSPVSYLSSAIQTEIWSRQTGYTGAVHAPARQ